MTRTAVPFSALLALSVIPLASSAAASEQESGALTGLECAEQAMQSIDFDQVKNCAARGLEAGNAEPSETARLHVLAGIAAAFTGEDREAERHFIVALAIQPALKLDQSLSPKIRQPYLDAVGFWGNREERIGLSAKLDDANRTLALKVLDPAELSAKVRLYVRERGGGRRYEVHEVASSLRARISLPVSAQTKEHEYFLALVDGRGNRLVQLGADDEPLEVKARSALNVERSKEPAALSTGERGRVPWVPLGIMALGLGSTATGFYFHLRREDAATRWNDVGCEQPGRSRIDQCGDIDRERATAERLAIGGYVAGGLLSATGIGLWVFGSSADAPRSGATRPTCGFGWAMVSVHCAGSF